MTVPWWHYLLLFAVAFVGTVASVPAVRCLANKLGAIDEPGPRRVNKVPVPRMGGVAMFVGLMAALAVEFIGDAAGLWVSPVYSPGKASVQVTGIIVAICFIVALGVLDDVYSLRPGVKFVGQIVACCIVVFTGTIIARFNLPFSNTVVSLGVWAYPLTIIYLVCFINIINLIDGLDGLAAGVTGIASITLFIMMVTLLRTDAAMIALALVGVCAGFLIFNFNPASIFMGDCGSMMLGLLLGTISVLGAVRFASVTIMIVPIVIALVPIIDTFGAIVRRVRGHEPISTADAGHIHHRLLRRGFTQRKAVLIIYLWTALLSLGAIMMWEFGGLAKYLVFTALLVISAFIVVKLGLFVPVRHHIDGAGKGSIVDKGDDG